MRRSGDLYIGNEFDTCFNSLKGQVDHAVIVNTSTDNGATTRALSHLSQNDNAFADVLECPENNLAMAQNMGIQHALANNYDWVLLLDHDSRLGAGMISSMEHAYNNAASRLNIAVIAPNLQDPSVETKQRYLLAWHHYWFKQQTFDEDTPVIDYVLCVAASGSLIPARVLRVNEFAMDESFVIDYIDTDFCLRVGVEGLRILAVRDAKLIHRIGERKQHKFCGLTITTTNHSPLRRYYLYRNRLQTWKRYAFEHPSFLMFDLLRTVYEMWRIILFETNKAKKFQYVVKGIWDGLRGVRGPCPGVDITRAGVLNKKRISG